jgi:hypothetical protein
VPDAELPSPVAAASTEFELLADTFGTPSSPTRAAASVALVALAAALPLSPTVAVAAALLMAETWILTPPPEPPRTIATLPGPSPLPRRSGSDRHWRSYSGTGRAAGARRGTISAAL